MHLKKEQAPPRNHYEILRGLAPSLVADLAGVAGQSLGELTVTLYLFAYGDRATLAAYDYIELVGKGNASGRMIRCRPEILDLVAAASYVCAELAKKHLTELDSILTDLTSAG